jgi:hypothetical protein
VPGRAVPGAQGFGDGGRQGDRRKPHQLLRHADAVRSGPRPDGPGDLAEPAATQQREEVPGIAPMVAGERLVGALTVEHHLDAGPARFGEDAPLREDGGRAEGLILVPCDLRGAPKDVLGPRKDVVRDRAGLRDHRLDEGALVNLLLGIASRDLVRAPPPGPPP